jgi:uncharacterized membrane protein YcaP (DUF421 family)
MLFDSWLDLLRIVAIGTMAYVALVTLLRISGKRTLSKMNAFDFIITVAMGSALANILLSSEVSLAEGVVALGLLVLLQFVIAWTSVRSATVRKLVKSEPALLVHRGEFLDNVMHAERVTQAEVLAALRSHGVGSVGAVDAVVLETDGSMSVIRSVPSGSGSVLHDIRGLPDRAG